MRFLMIIISMQIMRVLPRKYVSSSDESIENLLYYKDCQHKQKPTSEPPVLRNDNVQTPPTPRQPDCPFPKMCCSMSCGNDCGSPQSFLNRPVEPMPSMNTFQPLQTQQRARPPVQPQVMQRARKKKMKAPQSPFMNLVSRRDAGYTKDKIKSLISQDADIRKILKDLVRVTMQKVDLLEMINNRRKNNPKSAEVSVNSEEN